MRKFIFSFIIICCFVSCDKTGGLQYASILENEYGTEGTGKIIPLTVENAVELDGSIDKKGAYLCFSSDRERGNFDIYFRPIDDITIVRLTKHASMDYSPAISPNGKRVAFVSNRDDPEGDIIVMDIDIKKMLMRERSNLLPQIEAEENIKNISRIKLNDKSVISVKDANPSWSPNSKYIVFSSKRSPERKENIWMCKRNGNDKKQITFEGGMHPRFSPDGKKIVFISYRNNSKNGDIYIYDLKTNEEIRVTDTPYVEMYPAFGKNSNEIYFTQITKDTNENNVLDLRDKSDIRYLNIDQNISYNLTYDGNSSFSPRYFPVLRQKYKNSKIINFSGVVVFATQSGVDIDVNLVPEYGEIPKRSNIRDQWELTEVYRYSGKKSSKYYESLKRVYYYHYNTSNPQDISLIINSLNDYAFEMYKLKNFKELNDAIDLIKSTTYESNYKDFILKNLNFLKRKDIASAKKYSENYYLKNKNRIESEDIPYILQDIANFCIYANDDKTAVKYNDIILKNYQNYIKYNLVKFNQLKLVYGNQNVGSDIESLYKNSNYRDNVINYIIRNIENNKFDSEIIKGIEDENLYKSLQLISQASQNYKNKNYDETLNNVNQLIKISDNTSIFYYKSNIYLYKIYLQRKKIPEAYQALSKALPVYNVQWNDPEYKVFVDRMLTYFEETGYEHEKNNEYEDAINIYNNYADLVLKFKNNPELYEFYNKYSARSQALKIEVFLKKYPMNVFKMVDLENQYNENLEEAKKNFDKAHLYGLAYIKLNKALIIDNYYKNDKLGELKGFNEKDIVKSVNESIEYLDWCLFLDDTFIDAFLLKSWILQYLDVRRTEDKEIKGSLYSKIDKYYNNYLLEENIELIERAIEKNNEILNPLAEGNLYLNLGNNYYLINNYKKALKSFQNASKLKSSYSSKKEEALFYFHFAYSHWQIGNIKEARKEINKSYLIYSSMLSGSNNSIAVEKMINIMRYYALFERVNKNYKKSIELYNEIKSLASKYDIKIDKARYDIELAYCYNKLNNDASTFYYLQKAENRLKKREDNDKKYKLGISIFGFGPIPLIDVGPDAVAYGNTRLFEPLSNYHQQLLIYSIYEDIYTKTKNDIALIEVLKKKEKRLRKRNTNFSNDLKIRTLNNIGTIYYRLKNYSLAEKYYLQAWDFSSDEDINHLEGSFKSMKNLADLYCFLAEIGIDKDVSKNIDKVIKEITNYKRDYRKIRYKEEYEKKKKNLKLEDKKITEVDIKEINDALDEDVNQRYYEIDFLLANLYFYKNEFEINTVFTGKAESINAKNNAIFNLYSISSRTYEDAVKNSDNIYHKIKIMLNLAAIKDKQGFTIQAYELYGEIESLAIKYQVEYLMADIYFKQAEFIAKNYKKLGIKSSNASKYYRLGDLAVQKYLLVFTENLNKYSQYYEDYAIFLADSGKAEQSFNKIETAKKLLILDMFLADSPSLKNEEYRAIIKEIKDESVKIKRKLLQISKILEKENDEEKRQIIQLKKEITNNIKIQKNKFSGIGRSKVLVDLMSNKFLKNTYTFINNSDNLYFYKLKNRKSVVIKRTISNEDINLQMNQILKQNLDSENDIVIIQNNFMLQNFYLISDNFNNISIRTNLLNDIINYQNKKSAYSSFLNLNKSIVNNIKNINEYNNYSVIGDNKTTVSDFTKLVYGQKLWPEVIIKKIDLNERYEKILNLCFAAYFTNTDGFILQISKSKISEKNNLPSFVNEITESKNLILNSSEDQKYYNIGKNIQYNNNIDNIKLAESYLKEFEDNLRLNKNSEALIYLRKWNSSRSEKTPGQYELFLSRVYDKQNNFRDAISLLDKIKLNKISDELLKSKIQSYLVYFCLQEGLIDKARSLTSEINENVKDKEIFNNLYQYLDTAENNLTEAKGTYVNEDRMNLLLIKYLSIINTQNESNGSINIKKFANYNDEEKLFLYSLGYKNAIKNITDYSIKNIYKEIRNDNELYFDFNEGKIQLQDISKLINYKFSNDKEKINSLIEELNYIELINNSESLNSQIFISNLFQILLKENYIETSKEIFLNLKKSNNFNKKYLIPSIVVLFFDDLLVNNIEYKEVFKIFEDSITQNHKLYNYYVVRKALVDAKNHDYADAKKIIVKANENVQKEEDLIKFINYLIDFGLNDAVIQDEFKNRLSFSDNKLQVYVFSILIDRMIKKAYENQDQNKIIDYLNIKSQIISKSLLTAKFKYSVSKNNNYETSENLLDEIKQKLKDDEVILVFNKIENDVFIAQITKIESKMHLLKDAYQSLQDLSDKTMVALKNQTDLYLISNELTNNLKNYINIPKISKTVYIYHDDNLSTLPFEIIDNNGFLIEKHDVLFLTSLKPFINNKSKISNDIKVINSQNNFNDRIINIAIKESTIRRRSNSKNLHFQNNIIFNKNRLLEKSFLNNINNSVFLAITTLDNDISANSIAGVSQLSGADYCLTALPVINDINSAYFFEKFYYNLKNSTNVAESYQKSFDSLRLNLKYKNPSNWLYIRLYINSK